MAGSRSGSISQRHGSANPNPHQKFMDLNTAYDSPPDLLIISFPMANYTIKKKLRGLFLQSGKISNKKNRVLPAFMSKKTQGPVVHRLGVVVPQEQLRGDVL
jgi:hypothetical protein